MTPGERCCSAMSLSAMPGRAPARAVWGLRRMVSYQTKLFALVALDRTVN
jgi:hypothetical protein